MVHIILLSRCLQKIHGWLQNQKRNILMNLRSRETAIHENIKLKQENTELQKKLFDLLSKLDQKINTVTDAVQKIQDQKTLIVHQQTIEPQKKIQETDVNSVPMFIPTLNTGALKGNVQELKKKIRKSNIEDSLDKLSKLQDNL